MLMMFSVFLSKLVKLKASALYCRKALNEKHHRKPAPADLVGNSLRGELRGRNPYSFFTSDQILKTPAPFAAERIGEGAELVFQLLAGFDSEKTPPTEGSVGK
jgi:hypothetical protein